jgi:hypothetical protein
VSLVFFGQEGKCFFALIFHGRAPRRVPWPPPGGLSAIAVAGKGQMRGLAYGAKVFKEMNKAKETARPGRPGLLASAARLLSIAGCLTFSSVGHAADWNFAPPPPAAADYSENSGVPCSAGAPFWAPLVATAAVLPWPSVWLGHFSGGRPYVGGNGQTLVDWQDAKVCFPSRHQCQTWVRDLRRAYHRPEGYWTCLLLR